MKLKNKIWLYVAIFNLFLLTQTSLANNAKWNGTWSYPSRYYSSTLKITKQNSKQFNFEMFAMSGANMGEISGVAKIVGNKAFFDDKLSTTDDADKYGCKVTFTHKGKAIDVETNNECSSYAGNAVYFDREYQRGEKLPPIEKNFLQRKVFPNAKIDAKFKTLTGKDYETFLDSFHLVYDEKDLDKLNTKVFVGCVRGVCPWNTGIIMFDKKGNFYAMVFGAKEGEPEDSDKMTARYYSNNKDYSKKLPLTIKKWYEEKAGKESNIEIVFKSK